MSAIPHQTAGHYQHCGDWRRRRPCASRGRLSSRVASDSPSTASGSQPSSPPPAVQLLSEAQRDDLTLHQRPSRVAPDSRTASSSSQLRVPTALSDATPLGQWWRDDPSLEQRIQGLLQQRRAAEARELLRTRGDLRHGVSQFFLGVCTGMVDGEAFAVDAYEAAIVAMPGLAEAHINLVRALLVRSRPGDHDRALTLAKLSAASQPSAAMPRYNVGVILMQLGRTTEAAAAFEETLVVDPTHRGALINGAHTLTALRTVGGRGEAESLRQRILSLGRAGVSAGFWEHPQQRPPCFVRNLRPSRPWHDAAAFEMVSVLEAAYPEIKAELFAAQRRGARGGGDGVFTPVGGRAAHDSTIVAAGEWREMPLYGNGSRHEANCAMCPKTAAAIARCPLAIDLAMHGGGETLFSVVRG